MKLWRLAPRALADLDEIWTYVARQGDLAAAEWLLDELYSSIETLGQMPRAGVACSHIDPGLRSLPFGNYLICYRVRSRGGITVVRVIHGARDQRAAFDLT